MSNVPAASAPPRAADKRLRSLDALRGFDMLWIIGGAKVLTEIAKLSGWPWLKRTADFMGEHVEWEGFHFHDMIFPLFLFIIGVSIPYSLGGRLERGESRAAVASRLLRRTVLMFFIGWIYSGFLQFKPFEEFRVFGVLQRLALGYGVAGAIFLCSRVRGQAIAAVVLLVGYWAAMKLLPVPGFAPGDWSPQGNFANYVDRLMLQPKQMYETYGDPEGLFSTITAAATALIGVLTGHWLRTDRDGTRKAIGMAVAGVACIGAGYLWALDMPVIKKIWTSSYTLVAGGWSLLMLAAFYWIIDVRGWSRWSYFFVVIGMNSITIYLGQRVVPFDRIAEFFVGGVVKLWPAYGVLTMGVAALAIKWLALCWLHRNKIYLRL